MDTFRILVIGLGAVALAGCGTPESRCADGVAEMDAKIVRAADAEAYRAAADVVAQARERLLAAQREQEAGDYEACLDSLEQSRALLNRAGRN